METIFSKIITREIPATIIYEDDTALAFLDINPVNIGHTPVIPKSYSKNIYDIDDATLGHLMIVAKKIAIALKQSLHADGVNIEMNNDADAGQIIFHTHIHVVPRFKGDGFLHWKGVRGYEPNEASQIAEKIISALG